MIVSFLLKGFERKRANFKVKPVVKTNKQTSNINSPWTLHKEKGKNYRSL